MVIRNVAYVCKNGTEILRWKLNWVLQEILQDVGLHSVNRRESVDVILSVVTGTAYVDGVNTRPSY